MGRLSGWNYRRVTNTLKKLNFEFYRHAAGSHEIWFSPESRRFTTIPNHPGDLPEGTLHAILKQAGISIEQFLSVA